MENKITFPPFTKEALDKFVKSSKEMREYANENFQKILRELK